MSLPIIFFHTGNPRYLKYSLKQAKHFNPDSEIYLIGDGKNNKYPFVSHVLASKFKHEAEAFTALYKHRSSNDYQYELNCYLRWFYVGAFCRENKIESFIYLDSDVLLYHDFSELVPLLQGCEIANTCDEMGVPAVTYFRDYKAINHFCDYLIEAYNDGPINDEIELLYQPFAADPELFGGISDMVLFHLYFQHHPEGKIKIDLINNQIAVDACISRADGYETDKNGVKRIYWQNQLPYCKHLESGVLIRFATLHFQGDMKNEMRRNYTGGGYHFAKIADELSLKNKQLRKAMKTMFKKP
ncbi:hypothetical protein [Mucilaginibacter sp. UYCu711]|uniref:hypothetical protein n=1 Tax=Mucilaginibacter sp. UYCu711 TaxID=3156339 RepID=UPI003D1EEBD8